MRNEYGLFQREWKKGKIWYFWYWENNKRIYKSTGRNKKWEAKLYVEEYLNSMKKDTTDITLDEYAKDFFSWDRCDWIKRQHAKNHPFSHSVADARRSHLNNYLFPQFGTVRLSDINPVEVEDWLIDLPLANQTKNHILYTLSIILKEAKREKIIAINPIFDIESLGVRHKRRDILSGEELNILFPEDQKKFKEIWPVCYHGIMYALMVSSGMRSGEVRIVPWTAVIWQHSGILILRTISADGIIALPKGKNSTPIMNRQRVVILPDRTIELLNWWRSLTRYPSDDNLLFPGVGSKPLCRRTISIQFLPGLKRAGIKTDGRNLVTHSLRHTYNTRMKELLTGEIWEEFTGQGLLRDFTGHQSKKMTEYYDNPIWISRLEAFSKAKPQIEQFWR